MRHDGFLSYSHSDGALARELERGLEKLAKPLLKLRALDIFRDETSLASSPALWPSIVEHLAGSEWLLILCSRACAASPWCAKEIVWWLENRSIDRLLLLVTDGEVLWDAQAGDFDHDKTTALSATLRGRFREEPFYTDLRWAKSGEILSLTNPRFREAVLNVAAPLRGVPKDELDGADVRQLRKNRRLVRGLFAAIAAAALVAGWQWRQATVERDTARAQARIAMSRKLVADSKLPEYSLGTALLVAAEAYQIAPTRDAHENLIRMIHENDRFVQFLHGHDSEITATAIGPDGQTVVTGDKKGRVVAWKADWYGPKRAFRQEREAGGLGVAVDALRINGQGEGVVIAYANGDLSALPIGKGQQMPACAGWHRAEVALNADGSKAAVRGEGGSISLWKIGRPQCSVAFTVNIPSRSFALSPSGNRVAAVLENGDVVWRDVNGRGGTAKSPRAFAGGGTFHPFRVLLGADEKWMAAVELDRLALWSTAGGTSREVLTIPLDSQFSSMAFSRQGDKLAIGLADGTIDLWRLAKSPPAREQLHGHRHGFHVTGLAFNERGDLLASSAEDGLVMLWYFGFFGTEKTLSRELRGHANRVDSVTFSDHNLLVSSSGDAAIVWNAAVTAERPFLSYLGRNEGVSSSYYDPARKLTLAVPGVVLTDRDKEGCALVDDARSAAGRTLTPKELESLVGDLQYQPSCPPPKS